MEYGKVDKLKHKIIADAEAEARKIIEEGRAQAKGMRDEAQADADRITADSKAQAEIQSTEHLRRQTSLRELEARNALLGEKGKVIDEVFAKALEMLRRKDQDSGYALTMDLLLKAIESGDEEIVLAPEDKKRIPPGFLDRVNSRLRAEGKRAEVKLAPDTRKMKGGFILRRGRAETNAGFETLLAMLRDDVESDLAGVLFGETGTA